MPKINEMFAFIMSEPMPNDPDAEGIPAIMRDKVWCPMIGASMDRIDSWRELAQVTADQSGRPLKLIRFAERIHVETIEPGPRTDPAAEVAFVKHGPEGTIADVSTPDRRQRWEELLKDADSAAEVSKGPIPANCAVLVVATAGANADLLMSELMEKILRYSTTAAAGRQANEVGTTLSESGRAGAIENLSAEIKDLCARRDACMPHVLHGGACSRLASTLLPLLGAGIHFAELCKAEIEKAGITKGP